MNNRIPVLDKGYIKYVDHLGSDLAIVNAARASFLKESNWEYKKKRYQPNYPTAARTYLEKVGLKAADKKLLKYLAEHCHSSPFRHGMMTLEVKAPIAVCRQWWKYVVGSDHTMEGWNEASGRYCTLDTDIHHPEVWRMQATDKKQGSGGELIPEFQEIAKADFSFLTAISSEMYQRWIERGMAVEQARFFLPYAAVYTTWRHTGSVQSLCHLINQREKSDAQWEFQQYTSPLRKIVSHYFPESVEVLCPTTK